MAEKDLKKSPFFKQALAMVEVLPFVFNEDCFGLKGGTAINLFHREMPRLSVDIDLTYLPIKSREESLRDISESLRRIGQKIKSAVGGKHIHYQTNQDTNLAWKMVVSDRGGDVKIEPNLVFRGTVYPCENLKLVKSAQNLFEASITAKCLSKADLYGGKICAALERQHPRDLYDIWLMFEQEKGLPDPIRKAFVVYACSGKRPIHEILNPREKDIEKVFGTDFQGMTSIPVKIHDLLEVRKELITRIRTELTGEEREFFLSVKSGEPDWGKMGISGLEKLPAIQWKIQNIKRMDKTKRQEAFRALEAVLK